MRATLTLIMTTAVLNTAMGFSLRRSSAALTHSSTAFRLAMSDAKPVLNKYSRIITEPPSQGASQAMLYATGVTPDKINLPQVGIYSVWFYLSPMPYAPMHLFIPL
jgi:dihydroxy-acid dehydratase